jgi:hypothetical protein
MRALSLLLLSLLISAPALAQDEACKNIMAQPTPQLPTPPPGLKSNCDSAASYFGIARTVDYKAALYCAIVERAHPDDAVPGIYSAQGVLALIYANANGVPRNIPYARRFVCENEWLSGKYALEALDKSEHAAHPPLFDICDAALTTLSVNSCAALQERKTDAVRDKKISAIRSALTPDAQHAFDQLRAAETRFDETRVRNEIDLTGTMRDIYIMNDETNLRDQFLINLNRIAALTLNEPATLEAADRELNSAYRQLKATVPLHTTIYKDDSTVNFTGIQETQRAWLPLRDAWRNYAIAIHASAPIDKIIAMITVQRAHQLKMLTP